MKTYYQPVESGNSYATFCASFGPEMRSTYNSTNPYPLFPLCNCSTLDINSESFSCPLRYKKKLSKERLLDYLRKKQNTDFPYMYPEENSLNNKYRSLYFQDFNRTRNVSERLFVFKRHEDRELAIMENFFGNSHTQFSRHTFRVPLDLEVVGLVSIYDETGNISVSYLLEEVAIDEIDYVAQYIWEVNVFNTNYTLMPTNRKHWREFFGCHSTTALPLFTVLGILLYTIIVVVAISK